MPRIPTTTEFAQLDAPSRDPGYVHPAERRQGTIPFAFQVTSPLDFRMCLLPHALVLHVNPSTLGENFSQKLETFQTMGGFVEQHWFHDLSDMTAEASTGGFINLYTGLSSAIRRDTIAYDRFRDLVDLYRNNGAVYDPFGKIVLQGRIMLMYDRGTYIGTFRSFDIEETETSPFSFRLNWSFKVEQTILRIPFSGQAAPSPFLNPTSTQPLPAPGSTSSPIPRPSAAEDAIRTEQNNNLLTDVAYQRKAGSYDQTTVFGSPANPAAPSPTPSGNLTGKKK